MAPGLSRRGFLRLSAGAAGAAAAAPRLLRAAAAPVSQSVVGLVRGESRRKNVTEALSLVEDRILPVLRQRKYVVVKPNVVSLIQPLAASHADALHGILDFLAPRFKGPVVIAESSAANTFSGYEQFGYTKVPAEHKEREVSLVDLNAEGRYETLQILDDHLHLQPVRLAARLLDPDAYVICAAALKTHNAVVATLSIKNMALGAPLRSGPKESRAWSDKRRYHVGIRQMHYDILLTAQRMRPFWGATVIDGFEGMEGNGPNSGLPVPSRLAIASTDYVAADRVGVEAMGINPDWVGYLGYCGLTGVGQYDLTKIDVRGARIAEVQRRYQLHEDIERMLEWMGPMKELPQPLG
ncbi:MAG TPA: DUF362 domain-containing protein [Vicinamibacteria bacterium]|nr:DUF362 domain-containing protein [Vicinamibacteria bacterium]